MEFANSYHAELSENPNRSISDIHFHKGLNAHAQNGIDGFNDEHPHEQETDTETLNEEDIHEAAAAQAAPKRLSLRARLVTIPKRIPPALPPRNPNRDRPSSVDVGSGEIAALHHDGVSSNGSSNYEERDTGSEIPLTSPGLSAPEHMDRFDDVVLNGSNEYPQSVSETNANTLPSHDTISRHEIHDNTSAYNLDLVHDHTDPPPLNPNSTTSEPEPTTSIPPSSHPFKTDGQEREHDKEKEQDDFHSVPNTPSEVVSSGGGIPGAW